MMTVRNPSTKLRMSINLSRGLLRLIIAAILGGLAGVLILHAPITIGFVALSVLACLPVVLALFYGWVIQGFRN
jgi:hypothetical protein